MDDRDLISSNRMSLEIGGSTYESVEADISDIRPPLTSALLSNSAVLFAERFTDASGLTKSAIGLKISAELRSASEMLTLWLESAGFALVDQPGEGTADFRSELATAHVLVKQVAGESFASVSIFSRD